LQRSEVPVQAAKSLRAARIEAEIDEAEGIESEPQKEAQYA
jgi:hypothetical protein